MRHGSLFSGIGGFDLAAEWMGWENVFHCEWMEFPRKVLDYHFPNADSHIDICKTDFTKYANKIDILTGGFPCQPFSTAGKRKGTEDERYLWGEMLRAIQEIKPKFVIAENVYGITNIDGGLVFQQVCIDMEGEGYEVQPFIIPAAAKNAPHRRDRCWFVAYYNKRNGKENGLQTGREKYLDGITREQYAANSNGYGFQEQTNEQKLGIQRGNQFQFGKSKHKNDASNSNGSGFKGINNATQREHSVDRNSWHIFPTQSPICGGNDGLPTKLDGITFSKWRAESIKAYGNAIVPQVAYEIFKAIHKGLD